MALGRNLEWAIKVEQRVVRGDRVPCHLVQLAENALGRTFPRGGPVKRPDYADRAAGDDSFNDDRLVVL